MTDHLVFGDTPSFPVYSSPLHRDLDCVVRIQTENKEVQTKRISNDFFERWPDEYMSGSVVSV